MERLGLGEVVVEAVLDDGADRHLRAGPELLHRLGHDVRGVVADELERLRVRAGEDLDGGIAGDGVGEIGEPAVDGHGHGLLGEALGDGLRELLAGDPGGEARSAPSGNVSVISLMAVSSSHSPATTA